MKTTTPQKHHIETKFGRVRAYEKMKTRSRWKNPGVPEFERNWFLRFHCGGETWDEMAGPEYPVADGIKALKTYVETVMEVRLQAAREGKLDRLREVVAPARVLWLSEVLKVHEENTPKSEHTRKSRARLATIFREVLGLEPEEVAVCDKLWCRNIIDEWVRMRQEHFRRGWTVPGAEPADAWEILRADLKAKRLPAKDKVTELLCNTTIVGYITSAKSIFAWNNEYLPRLKLPDLREFLEYKPGVNVRKGARTIDPEALQRVMDDLPQLKRVHPAMWACVQVMAWSGQRGVSLGRMSRRDITWLEDGGARLTSPPTKAGERVLVDVPAEIARVLEEIATEQDLFGTGFERLRARRVNPWLKERGVGAGDTLTSYLFRHLQMQRQRDAVGKEMATLVSGHRDAKTLDHYTNNNTAAAGLVPVDGWPLD